MIDSKMICFENKRNDFAHNYFADGLESSFHAREKKDPLQKKKDTLWHLRSEGLMIFSKR